MIKLLPKQLFRLFLFWMLVFLSGKLIFYIIANRFFNECDLGELIQIFFQGFFIDLSTFAYASILPIIFYLLAFLFHFNFLSFLSNILTIILIVIYTTACVGEAILYTEWQAKLSVQALAHFSNPSEVFKTASLSLTLLFFGLIFLTSSSFIFLYKKHFWWYFHQEKHSLVKRVTYFFLFLTTISGAWLIMIRGGVKAIPIQISDAYFSQKPILNDATINPAWNLVSDFTYYLTNQKNEAYIQIDNSLAEQRIREMYNHSETTNDFFLTTQKPNIVFIILESWTAHCIKAFGGDDFATFTDSLANEGIFFSNAYASGHVSDQGIAAILSGQPCVSRMSVVNQTSKSGSLPSLNESLKPLGYNSGFYFGGDLNYGNIRGYLFNKKWDIIKEERDYSDDVPKGKLGIQDKEMADVFIREINRAKTPFIYAWFTLSSHMPYDFEGEKKQLTDIENDYTNSIIYTDNALKDFFKKAKQQAWYKNTLFVVSADHSHACHKNYRNHEPMYHQIPILFFGEVIKPEYRGLNFSRPFSQINIAKTLLHQMNLTEEAKKYSWSQDAFSANYNPFAYFCSFSFGGIVSPKGSVSFALEGGQTYFENTSDKALSDSLQISAKAFQQMVFKDYSDR